MAVGIGSLKLLLSYDSSRTSQNMTLPSHLNARNHHGSFKSKHEKLLKGVGTPTLPDIVRMKDSKGMLINHRNSGGQSAAIKNGGVGALSNNQRV